MRVATDEDEPGAAIGYGEIGRLAATSGNGHHGDMKKLAKRLVQVLEPSCGQTSVGQSSKPSCRARVWISASDAHCFSWVGSLSRDEPASRHWQIA
jgi:hypothetical protein